MEEDEDDVDEVEVFDDAGFLPPASSFNFSSSPLSQADILIPAASAMASTRVASTEAERSHACTRASSGETTNPSDEAFAATAATAGDADELGVLIGAATCEAGKREAATCEAVTCAGAAAVTAVAVDCTGIFDNTCDSRFTITSSRAPSLLLALVLVLVLVLVLPGTTNGTLGP